MEITFGTEEEHVTVADARSDDDVDSSISTLSVLIVDDQPEMQEIVVDMLSSLGHSAASSASAQDAYARYIAGSFDVVLPQEEGHTLAQWIKSHRVDMPVVMMADAGAREMIELVDAVLTKPFAIEQLHECLLNLTEEDIHGHVSVSGYDDQEKD